MTTPPQRRAFLARGRLADGQEATTLLDNGCHLVASTEVVSSTHQLRINSPFSSESTPTQPTDNSLAVKVLSIGRLSLRRGTAWSNKKTSLILLPSPA